MFGRGENTVAFRFDEGCEQLFLVLEINVDRSFGNTCLTGDVVHAGSVETLLHEDDLGAIDNLLALGRIFAGGLSPASAVIGIAGTFHILFHHRSIHQRSHNSVPRHFFEPIGSISLDMCRERAYVNRTERFGSINFS